MFLIILQILTISFPWNSSPASVQEIWKECFPVPEKGVWGGNDGLLQSDFSGITAWTLDYSDIELTAPDDYAKTVSTSGGRFECRDIDGEVVWHSEPIDISAFNEVNIRLTAYETGSGANPEAKYLKAFYQLDDGSKIPFSTHGKNEGNWGSVQAVQDGLTGDTLRIICTMGNHYANDKVTLNDVIVWKEAPPLPEVKPYDVVINELMPDPYPPVELPNAEYIELYNTRSSAVNTEDWELRINGVAKKLQKYVIEAGKYLILCATGSLEELVSYGSVSNVVGFQGLPNKKALVEILDENETVIDRVEYNDQWYGQEEKEKGGWSLERIDPNRHCNQEENWKAGNHPAGGTPGSENSIRAENSDTLAPIVKWAAAVAENEIELVFSEAVDTMQLMDTENYILKERGNPAEIKIVSSKQMTLHFNRPFIKNKIYTLQVNRLADECGNHTEQNQFEIQWNTIEPGDVVINEVLFDPFPGGEDYVEIYNNSEKMIVMSRLNLANRDKDLELKQVYRVSEEKYIFPPDSYLALTKDTSGVFPWFYTECPSCFLQMERVPSFPNAGGYVVLVNEAMQVIDEFYYTEKMHSPFLNNTEGVSLERVSPAGNTNDPGNWHSASTGSGYGTPGYENSQAGKDLADKPRIICEPEAFSPNHDGYNDEYHIHYTLEKPGYAANIKIFDVAGRFVMHLAKNEILELNGSYTWNGNDETGQHQPLGVYIVLVEIFNEKGTVHRYKDSVVLTGLLE